MPRIRSHRILLVNPRQTLRHYSVQFGLARLSGRRSIMPSLSLAVLAAHTPEGWHVRIADEETGAVPYDDSVGVVGITALSNTIDRAYAIADRFRARGVPVVLGGPHATFCPEETGAHADAVVQGEAEGVWPQLLSDLEQGALKRTYRTEAPMPVECLRPPRWDLVDHRQYVALPVQATRGCPYGCEFCLVPRMFGRSQRVRPVEAILAEVAALPLKRVFFVDDNLTIDRRFARELVAGLAPLGISWNCQASMDIADDPELVRRMAEAGCGQVLLGFESLNPASIAETGKDQNRLERYERAVQGLRDAGMFVIGSFIVGFDHDTVEEFDRITHFCGRMGLCFVSINLLGASPGTALHARLLAGGRLCDTPAEWRGGMLPVIRYARMSQAELFSGFTATLQRFFASEAILQRARVLFASGRFTRPHPAGDVTLWRRAWISLRLLAYYLATLDRSRRRLFLWLLGRVRSRQVASERALFFLLSMQGFRANIQRFTSRRRRLLARIAAADPGPWGPPTKQG